ncbi:MAG: AgmX/PglI C-terminal domain-containing protein [Deltaproteobacteria bacterium]|nr:AgmX/PglI C-terminal domain-containing protein [Deltaproteobacteria bacterium]
MRKKREGSGRCGGSRIVRTMLLLATVVAGACGAATAGEAAAEPEDPGAPVETDDGATTESPGEPEPLADGSSDGTSAAADAMTAGAPPLEPQQAAQAAPPEPEPAEIEPPEPAAPPTPPGDGRLRIGRPEIARGGGRVNGNLFARAVERKRGGMLACYNVPLGADSALRGDLVMVLVVDPQGMVGVNVEEDDEALAAAGVTHCVIQKLRQVSFSETPPGSELWVRIPLEFRP